MSLPTRCHRTVLRLGLAVAGLLLLATPARAGILDASWTAPTTNFDGTPLTDLAGYRVYYGSSSSACPGGQYFHVVAAAPSPAPDTTVSYRLTGLVSGASYFVSVTAVNTSDGESDCFTPAQSAVARIDFAVSPTATTDFGSVATGSFADRTFTVQNTGGGTVDGTVSTSAPFSVVSGGTLSLTGLGATQTVTVRFRPSVAATASVNVTFTANGASISRLVTGSGTGSTADNVPPTVAITAPTLASTYGTHVSPLTLKGTASDDVGVSQVTWANDRGGTGTASGTTSWTASGIVLQPGANVVTVTAQDAAGNSATDSVTVTFDVTPPAITITIPTSHGVYATRTSTLTLGGTASDNFRVSKVTWTNNRGGSGRAIGSTSWRASGIVLQPGANVLTATVRDAAGNTATDSVTVTLDTTPPTVAITPPASGAPTSPLTLTGTASDNILVTRVTWTNDRGGSGTATGTTSWTASGIILQPGTNVLTVTAWDRAGNASAPVTVTVDNSASATLVNGGFESFTGGVATGWTLATDGVVGFTATQDAGHSGLAQKVTITSAGTWGLYLSQRPGFQLGRTYTWTFWYKTSGANTIWAQVANAPLTQIVLSQALAGTSGVWTQQTLTFTYANALADQLRISASVVGSFWLDEVTLGETAP